MRIGIDVSQLAYSESGVEVYLRNLVESLLDIDKENSYILFFSSLRKKLPDFLEKKKNKQRVLIRRFFIPPLFLDFLWNRLHIMPIENFVGEVDWFITSDWTEPPTKKAKKATILYDLVVYKYPEETSPKIVATQKRKLRWVKKESERIFCISEATATDAKNLLGIPNEKIVVLYPGV